MPTMPDLYGALLSFQNALQDGLITPGACILYPELSLLMDDANGQSRLTFARIDKGSVKAIVAYLEVEPHEGKRCFQVGYAVAEPYRNQGIATEILTQSIEEIRHGFKPHAKPFFIEAVVEADNHASIKVAERVIAPKGSEITDDYAGLPAVQFLQLVEY
jgi:ribosomal protein S18 acetylase RimI-like enzyme